jgi:type II secretory pathway predicted ATPase ExeA
VALLTGDPGVGKTSALRLIADELNPHRYQVIYMAETDFGRMDLYRQLGLALGLEPAFRRSQLWRDIKAKITELADGKHILPVWIIDEAQNLPIEFFKDFPAFLNFAFDSRDLMTVWFVGHSALAQSFARGPLAALASRVHLRMHFSPVMERERFSNMIRHGLQCAGCKQTLMSDSGIV